nr:hypothetical protein [Priestia megaterium]
MEKQILAYNQEFKELDSTDLEEGICNNIEQERSEDVQQYSKELEFIKRELKEKVEEEANL